VNDPYFVDHINSIQNSWVAGFNEQFEGNTYDDVKS